MNNKIANVTAEVIATLEENGIFSCIGNHGAICIDVDAYYLAIGMLRTLEEMTGEEAEEEEA